MRPFGVLMSLLVLSAGCEQRAEEVAAARVPVVYGTDDRVDVYAHPDEGLRALVAQSIVALVYPEHLDQSDPTDVLVVAPDLQTEEDLCDGEPFASQPTAASCSGTLIDADLVLTAGHCVSSLSECQSYRYVFGYHYEADGTLATITTDDIYECADRFVYRDDGEVDYGVVRLDRPVAGARVPAPLRVEDSPLGVGAAVTVIGFGSGLPAKIDDGGSVLDDRPTTLDYFTATTDTFHSSSGSGVFDATGRLTGILVRGEDDWTDAGGCWVTRTLPEEAPPGDGEEATYLWRAIEAMCLGGWESLLCDGVAVGPANDCTDAEVLAAEDAVLTGAFDGRHGDNHRGSCAGLGPDRVYAIDVDRTVRMTATATGVDTVLHLRTVCDDPATEIACEDDSDPPGGYGSRIVADLEPGAHYLVLDTYEWESGPFRLELRFDAPPVPDAGTSPPDAGTTPPDAGAPVDAGADAGAVGDDAGAIEPTTTSGGGCSCRVGAGGRRDAAVGWAALALACLWARARRRRKRVLARAQ